MYNFYNPQDPHCSGAGAMVLLATGWTVLTVIKGDEVSEKNSEALHRSGLANPWRCSFWAFCLDIPLIRRVYDLGYRGEAPSSRASWWCEEGHSDNPEGTPGHCSEHCKRPKCYLWSVCVSGLFRWSILQSISSSGACLIRVSGIHRVSTESWWNDSEELWSKAKFLQRKCNLSFFLLILNDKVL